jgi:hypothetical protein
VRKVDDDDDDDDILRFSTAYVLMKGHTARQLVLETEAAGLHCSQPVT